MLDMALSSEDYEGIQNSYGEVARTGVSFLLSNLADQVENEENKGHRVDHGRVFGKTVACEACRGSMHFVQAGMLSGMVQQMIVSSFQLGCTQVHQ